jgi:hypothetical protein
MQLLIPHLVGHVQRVGNSSSDTRRIDIAEFLHLSVESFRISKQTSSNNDSWATRAAEPSEYHLEDGRLLQPLPGQSAPPLRAPDPSADLYQQNQHYEQRFAIDSSSRENSGYNMHPLRQKYNTQNNDINKYQQHLMEEENAPLDLEEDVSDHQPQQQYQHQPSSAEEFKNNNSTRKANDNPSYTLPNQLNSRYIDIFPLFLICIFKDSDNQK